MRFDEELDSVLPLDIPHRARVIAGAARHLELIVDANRHFNLTRITSPREAAIKHVLDSLLPWRHFAAAASVLDAGTGAGFPGIPLALALPQTAFILTDSVGKKARFAADAVSALGIVNVKVSNERAEQWLGREKSAVLTGRAVTPLDKACALFAPALRSGTRGLFYKGPDAGAEIAHAASVSQRQRLRIDVIERYRLPDDLGVRTLVGITG